MSQGEHEHCRNGTGIGLNGIIFIGIMAILSRFSPRIAGMSWRAQVMLLGLCLAIHYFIEYGTRSSCSAQPENTMNVMLRNVILFFIPSVVIYILIKPYLKTTETYAYVTLPQIVDVDDSGMMTKTVDLVKGKEIGESDKLQVRYVSSGRTEPITRDNSSYITITTTNARSIERKAITSSPTDTWYIIHVLYSHEHNKNGQIYIVKGDDERDKRLEMIDRELVTSNGVKGVTTQLNADKRLVINQVHGNVVHDPIVHSGVDGKQIDKMFESMNNRNPFNNSVNEKADFDKQTAYRNASYETMTAKGF